VATGRPPIDTYAFDFGPFTVSGDPGTDDAPVGYCPGRTVLDKLLVVARLAKSALAQCLVPVAATVNSRVGRAAHFWALGRAVVPETGELLSGSNGFVTFVIAHNLSRG